MVRDRAHKLSIVKTLRLSETLLQMIKAECGVCNLRFSDFMRNAAIAALNREEASQCVAYGRSEGP
jgi:hypothetical protein